MGFAYFNARPRPFFVIIFLMAEIKNVLIATNSGNCGGMEVHVLNILEGLHKDFNFYVVCPSGNIVSEYEKYAKVINLSPKFDIDPIYILKLVRLLKMFNISVLHAHELKVGVNGLIAASLAKVLLRISHQHTPISNWQISPAKKKMDAWIYKFFVNKFSDCEIALTSEIKRQKIKEGVCEKKLIIIPNGVDIKRFNLPTRQRSANRLEVCKKYDISPRDLIIGNISRLTIEKGHALLIKAVRILENEGKLNNARFLIVGDGELRDELMRMVKSYGLSGKITFAGFVSEEEKCIILTGMDVFVFPTLAEGFGIVLIEAMSSKLPCVVSDLPVLKDVASDSVLYFRQGDEKSLGEGLEKVIASRTLREKLSKESAKRAGNYDIRKFCILYKDLYENTLSIPS